MGFSFLGRVGQEALASDCLRLAVWAARQGCCWPLCIARLHPTRQQYSDGMTLIMRCPYCARRIDSCWNGMLEVDRDRSYLPRKDDAQGTKSNISRVSVGAAIRPILLDTMCALTSSEINTTPLHKNNVLQMILLSADSRCQSRCVACVEMTRNHIRRRWTLSPLLDTGGWCNTLTTMRSWGSMRCKLALIRDASGLGIL